MWPAVEPPPGDDDGSKQPARSYMGMSLALGLLGLALPPLLVRLEPALFDGQPSPRGSLSAYYYSGMREIFVGGLCAIGVFLISYRLVQRTLENLFSIVAGVAAVTVAIFPTQRPGQGFAQTPLQALIGEDEVTWIHYRAAIVFVGLLAVLSILFGVYRRYRLFHFACAAAIVVAGALGLYAAESGGPNRGLLYAEWAAVWAFGASWLATVDFRLLFGRL